MAGFHFRDAINLLSKLTIRRSLNAFQVVSSFYYSKITGKAVQWGMPVSVSIEPTTSCNLRCPECVSGLRKFTRDTGMIQETLFSNIIDELGEKLWYLTFYFQGEPYLHPGFTDMVNYASSKGIYTATSTNGHFLNKENSKRTVESGLDRLIISIDGTTQSSYETYRIGGNLNKVLAGTRNIIKWKRELRSKTPHLIFQFLVTAANESEVDHAVKLAQSIGVDEIQFKTAQVYEYEHGNDLIPKNEKYSRYRKNEDGTFSIKNSLLNHCWRLWHSSVITWDGKVVPCCFDKDAQHLLGDLKQDSFTQIWQSTAYLQFRSAVLRSRKEIDICSNCSEGSPVWG